MDFLNQIFPQNDVFIRQFLLLQQREHTKSKHERLTQNNVQTTKKTKKITVTKRCDSEALYAANPFLFLQPKTRNNQKRRNPKNGNNRQSSARMSSNKIKDNEEHQINDDQNIIENANVHIDRIEVKKDVVCDVGDHNKKDCNNEDRTTEEINSSSSSSPSSSDLTQTRSDLVFRKFLLIVKKGKTSELLSFLKNNLENEKFNINELMPLGPSIYSTIQERGGPFDGWGAIHIAAWRGDVSILKILIDHGIDIHHYARQNEQAISIATWKGNTEIVNELLSHGANIHAQNPNRFGQEPIHLCVIKNRPDILSLIFERSKLSQEQFSPLLYQCMNITLQLKENCDFSIVKQITDWVSMNYQNSYSFFFENAFYNFILSLAKSSKHYESLSLLSYFPTNQTSSSMMSFIKSLLECNSVINYNNETKDYNDVLVKLIRAYFQSQPKYYLCELIGASLVADNLEVFQHLLSYASDLNYLIESNGILLLLCQRNAFQCFRYLIECSKLKKSLYFSKSVTGETIFHVAVRNNRSQFVDYILENMSFDLSLHTSDLNENVLHMAARVKYNNDDDDDTNFFSKIQNKFIFNKNNNNNNSQINNDDMMKLFESENSSGMTPLHIAAANLNYNNVKLILEITKHLQNKNYNHVNFINHKTKFTALHYVVKFTTDSNLSESLKLIDLLLENNANIKLTCNSNDGDENITVTQLASSIPSLMTYLIKRGADCFDQIVGVKKVQKSWKLLTFEDFISSELEDIEAGKTSQNLEEIMNYSSPSLNSQKSFIPKLRIRNQRWKEIRLFLSSTFIDMFNERELLIKKVIPRVKEFCYQNQIHLTEIDLRWGVTEEEVRSGKALEYCLSEAKDSDIFCGILGHRYGWIPDSIPQNIYDQYHWKDGSSITQMEIQSGVFEKQSSNLPFSALFFIRSNQFLNSVPSKFKSYFEETERSKNEKIKALRKLVDDKSSPSQFSVTEYSPICSGEMITVAADIKYPVLTKLDDLERKFEEQLIKIITTRFISPSPSSSKSSKIVDDHQYHVSNDSKNDEILDLIFKMEQERNNHSDFIEFRSRSFIGREKLIREIMEVILNSVSSESQPIVIHGKPGSGKSSLVSKIANDFYSLLENCKETDDHYRDLNGSDYHLIYHFVGATQHSTSIYHTITRICFEIIHNIFYSTLSSSSSSNNNIETDYEKLVVQFHELLDKISKLGDKKVVIIIDALNQFDLSNSSHSLDWLPLLLPKNVTFVVSCLPGDCLDVLFSRKLSNYHCIDPLSSDDQKRIISNYLQQYSKKLTDQQIDMILMKSNQINPLYLTIIGEELRIFGQHELIHQKIESFPSNVISLIENVLIRLENEFNFDIISKILGLIECSRFGLLEHEIIDILSIPRYQWNDILLSLKFFLRPFNSSNSNHDHSSSSSSSNHQNLHNERILDYFHRQIAKAIHSRYFAKNPQFFIEIHSLLADYFYDKIHPDQFSSSSSSSSSSQSSNILQSNKSKSAMQSTVTAGYSRGFSEVNYHLIKAKKFKNVSLLLTSLLFIEKKCSLGFTFELINDYLEFTNDIQNVDNNDDERNCDNDINIAECQHLLSLIDEFKTFVISNSHIFMQFPHLIYQTALNDPLNKNLSKSAESQLALPSPSSSSSSSSSSQRKLQYPLMRWRNKPTLKSYQTQSFNIGSEVNVSVSTLDHQFLIIGTKGGSVKVIDRKTGQEKLTLIKQPQRITSIAVSNDNQLLTITYDQKLAIYSIQNFTLVSLTTFTDCEALSSDIIVQSSHSSSLYSIITGDFDGIIQCYSFDLSNHKLTLLHSFFDQKKILYLKFAPFPINNSNPSFISCSSDKSARIYSLNGKLMTIFVGHTKTIKSASFIPSLRWCITASQDYSMKIWNAMTGELIITLNGHTDNVQAVNISTDEKYIISGSWDKTVRVWSIQQIQHHIKEKLTCEISNFILGNHSHFINFIHFMQPNDVLSGSVDMTAKIFKIPNNIDELLNESNDQSSHHRSLIVGLDYNKEDQLICTGSWDRTAKLFDRNGVQRSEFTSHLKRVNDSLFTHNCKYLITSSMDGTNIVWNLKKKKKNERSSGTADSTNLNNFESHSLVGQNANILCSAVSHDDRYLVTGSNDGNIFFWDLENLKLIDKINKAHHQWVVSLAFSPFSRLLVSGCTDGSIYVWKTCDGSRLFSLVGHTRPVLSIRFHSSGKYIISGAEDKLIKVWSTTNYQCVHTLSGHQHEVTMIELIDPDDPVLYPIFQSKSLFVSSSSDKTLRFWDFITGKLLWIYYGLDAFMSVKYCGDGLFAAGDSTGRLSLISIFPPKN